jgi:hypothetical protein
MSGFNRMTVVAAAEVLASFNSHDDMEVFEVQWGIDQWCKSSSKSGRAASWAKIALDRGPEVITENGPVTLSRALIETAIKAPPTCRSGETWSKFVAGLRFDGFEPFEQDVEEEPTCLCKHSVKTKALTLKRMLPKEIPEIDFREAENEVVGLLDRFRFTIAKGHLDNALSAFQRGEWSSANGELRNFYEEYLNSIALGFGYRGQDDSKLKRDYLGKDVQPPFLIPDYNEWNENNQKPQYVQGLMSRMHPHGGHPGLSEEEDATFRLQITLITARLFLRRYDRRTR